MVAFCEEGGEGREHEVHEAVDVGHVAGEDLDDGLCEEELEGPFDGDAERGWDGALWVVEFGVKFIVSGFFAQFVALSLEEFGRVGFLEEHEAETLYNDCEDGCGVEAPSPRRVF